MQLTDGETEKLKSWLIKRLEDISDADSDVLADYVLALVKTDEPVSIVRSNCVDNLRDFLQDDSERFVDEVLQAIETKAYEPGQVAPKRIPPAFPSQNNSNSRKRAFGQEDDGNGLSTQVPFQRMESRPAKQSRRGGSKAMEQRHDRASRQQGQQWAPQPLPDLSQDPSQLQGMPFFDPQNAMAALLAMQQAMGLPLPAGMESFSNHGKGQIAGKGGHYSTARRCRDYDSKGFCGRGASCPYEHGMEALVVPQNAEYDPSDSSIIPLPSRVGYVENPSHSRRRGESSGWHKRPGQRGSRRADFSQRGSNEDRSLTGIVVEQIPEENFNEESVHDFFSQFGSIMEVDMQPHKMLAIVTFDSYDSARAAYDSPKVIFDNRFVKVYWYNPTRSKKHRNEQARKGRLNTEGDDMEMTKDDILFDLAEISKRQEEAQHKHDEARRKREEVEQQKADIDARLRAMDAESKKIVQSFAKQCGDVDKSPAGSPLNGNEPEESEQTKALKAQLAKLEAEAKSLGIEPQSFTSGWYPTQQQWGRGNFVGRVAFRGRGRGRGSGLRGGWAGGNAHQGAVKRLDNRPKSVSVVLPGSFDKFDESLRQYLLLSNQLDHATLSRHPSRDDAAVVAFQERYRAENFLVIAKTGSDLPNIGPVEVSWLTSLPDINTNGNGASEQRPEVDLKVGSIESTMVADTEPVYDVAEDDGWN